MRTKTLPRYNPGTPGLIEKIGPALYLVESHRERGTFYRVNLAQSSCSCPAHQNRGTICKHQIQARQEARRAAWQAALALPIEALARHADRADLRPEVREAVNLAFRFRREADRLMHIPQELARF